MRRSFPGSSFHESRGRPARRWALAAGLAVLAAGCSSGGKAGMQVSPRDAGNQALAEYDTNQDGFLDTKELAACPGLLAALKRVDKDGDGRLTADEIADRIAFFQQQDIQSDVSVEVLLDNRPLVGATVTLVPEKFMGPAAKSATATTDESGTGGFAAEAGEPVACGYYKVQVSKAAQGRESVPAKYNAQTTLGYEVSPDAEGRGTAATLRLRLTSR